MTHTLSTERTGWRDSRIAARHALYHDIDTTKCEPTAIYDFKKNGASRPSLVSPSASQKVLTDLGNRANLPVFNVVLTYTTAAEGLRVRYELIGLNKIAKMSLFLAGFRGTSAEMSEIGFVDFERRLMGLEPLALDQKITAIKQLGAYSDLDFDAVIEGEEVDFEEASEWQHSAYSDRHRTYGFNCPCLDLDGILTQGGSLIDSIWSEYDQFCTVALVSVGNHQISPSDANFRALEALSDRLDVDRWAISYDPKTWNYTVACPGEDLQIMTEAVYKNGLAFCRQPAK